jgi:hypothetical protein
MTRLIFVLTGSILVASPLRAEDSTVAELTKAKATYAKEMARLRDKLLADIDAVIKAEQDRGAGINYVLRERKGFEEGGVVPILPKLLPASGRYLDGKKAADADLERAYAAAIDAALMANQLDLVAGLRAELKKVRAPAAEVGDRAAREPDPKGLAALTGAKAIFRAATKAAEADLIRAFEQARQKVADSRTLAEARKLERLSALAKEKEAFERNEGLPRLPEMREAVGRFRDAAAKARQDFNKSADAVAKEYQDRKDVAAYEAVLREKRRFLAHPTAIDLLALIDLSKDVLRGEFKLEKGILTIPGSGNALIEIPYEPAAEYDLHLTVERVDGDDLLAVGLIASGKQFYALFDGWPGAGCRSGIQYIDGKLLLHNGTEKAGRVLPVGKPVELDVSVRRESIRVWATSPGKAERRTIVDYGGSQNGLAINDDLGIKNKKALFLLTLGSKVAVSAYELTPVGTDPGKSLR